uniref:Uncharacterized protein n=1 Tax=Arundo donax TaxID=35708 RepID=A0A0A9AAD8_ARUDO
MYSTGAQINNSALLATSTSMHACMAAQADVYIYIHTYTPKNAYVASTTPKPQGLAAG